MGFGIWVQNLEYRIQGFGFRVQNLELGFDMQGKSLGFNVQGLGYKPKLGIEFQGQVYGLGFCFYGFGIG